LARPAFGLVHGCYQAEGQPSFLEELVGSESAIPEVRWRRSGQLPGHNLAYGAGVVVSQEDAAVALQAAAEEKVVDNVECSVELHPQGA
jgi:hypothetical protein